MPGALHLTHVGFGLPGAILIPLGNINLPISMPIDIPETP